MPLDVIQDETGALLKPLLARRVAIVGYGNQGRAHALNLRDSGCAVNIGARQDGAGWRRAIQDGFQPAQIARAAAGADLVILALPDEIHARIWRETLVDVIQPGQTIGFIHGFSVHYGHISPAEGVGVVMVAPKGPGTTLRSTYEQGRGIPALLAVHQECSEQIAESLALGWAAGIGSARAAIIRTTFAAETESDLFGEQAVLCGGMVGLIRAAFRVLIEAGYPPELAYIECCHEVKQVADLVYERGLSGMMEAISNTAEFGAYRAATRVVDEACMDRMRVLLGEIKSGEFARDVVDDHANGSPWLMAQRKALLADSIEQAGATVRSFMPGLGRESREIKSG